MGSNGKPKQARVETKQAAFLAALAEVGNITVAARAAQIDRRLHYDWMAIDPGYPGRYRDAVHQAGEALEAEARRRAVDGVPEPIFYKGEPIGAVRKYSDTLLIFMMKGAMPHKYRDRVEHSGDVTFTLADAAKRLREARLVPTSN